MLVACTNLDIIVNFKATFLTSFCWVVVLSFYVYDILYTVRLLPFSLGFVEVDTSSGHAIIAIV